MAPGRKTGGRIRGVSINKPKPIILEPTNENRELVAMAQVMRTPKSVILDAMMRFETLGLGFLAKADRMMKTRADASKVAEIAHEGHKYIVAAVECATKVAPYIHARLLAVESRGDMTQDQAPFVIRVPAVVADSKAWQAAVGSEILDIEATQAASVVRQTEVSATLPPASVQNAPATAPAPLPVVLAVDPKNSRITAMPPGPKVVQPAGAQEWLDAVAAERRKAAG